MKYFTLILAFAPFTLQAQWLVGIKAGVARANMLDSRAKDGAAYDYEWRTTPQAAFLVEAPLSERFGLSLKRPTGTEVRVR